MKVSTIAIAALAALLIASNAYWAYRFVDSGVSYAYLEGENDQTHELALQALALLPEVARANNRQDAVVAAAVRSRPSADPFEKDGFVWVDFIGLRFDENGQLVEARAR